MANDPTADRVDRTAFSVAASFAEADEADRRFWWSRTPEERIRALELLRRRTYGSRVDARLQRVLEVARRAPR